MVISGDLSFYFLLVRWVQGAQKFIILLFLFCVPKLIDIHFFFLIKKSLWPPCCTAGCFRDLGMRTKSRGGAASLLVFADRSGGSSSICGWDLMRPLLPRFCCLSHYIKNLRLQVISICVVQSQWMIKFKVIERLWLSPAPTNDTLNFQMSLKTVRSREAHSTHLWFKP